MKVASRKIAKARKDCHTLIKIIKQNPGIHFREILRVSGLGNGTLQYRLALLKRFGLLRIHRAGGFTRYYNSDVPKADMDLLFDLKQRTCREIIRLMLDDSSDVTTFQEIVQMIGKAPSTVSVQLMRLIGHKVVIYDKKRGYIIKNKPAIKRLISKYKV